ncbi:MAG: hypothetical protein Q4G34_10205 [Micrococcus sp.]|nr:hypothetical protein [Micrococcus sp.]
MPEPAPVILGIDGRSGSGKSTLTAALVTRLRRYTQVSVVPLDEMYPGWDGLSAVTHDAGPYLAALRRLRDGAPGAWPVWDWAAEAPGPCREVPAAPVIVCEGVGALCRPARELVDVGIWLEADADERRRRALVRDGATFAPHWERWAAHEARYLAEHRPDAGADIVVRGTV